MKQVGKHYVIETNEFNSVTAVRMFGETRPIVRVIKSEIELLRDGSEKIVHTVIDSNGQMHLIDDKSVFSEQMTLIKNIELNVGDEVELDMSFCLAYGDNKFVITHKIANGKNINSFIYKMEGVSTGKILHIYNDAIFFNNILT